MLGTLLNERYQVVRVLGSGGFGKTYIAEDIQHPDSPVCVVKQFQPSRREEAFLQIARRLFDSEVSTLCKLGSHAQIPTLIADFEENQEFFLVQEYIEGRSLSEELSEGRRLPECDVVALLRDVLQILEFVHENHVIHRDIKPGNLIRRQRDRKFVLIDFGAVKEIQTQIATGTELSNLTVSIGTQGYGPSEQLMGKPRYNSDLYALGMTAIQALTGIQPIQLPTDPDTAEVLWREQAQVSPGLAAILDKMVRYHFSQRFQSATEVLYALDRPTEIPSDTTQIPITRLSTDTFVNTGAVPNLAPGLKTVLPDEADLPTRILARRVQKSLRAVLSIGFTSLAVTGALLGLRYLGWLEPLEVAIYDRLVQLSPVQEPDDRLLVVGITEQDIQTQKRFPLSDRTIAQTLRALQVHEPRAIGLDLLRDIPQEPGRQELLTELKVPNVIAITKLGGTEAPPTGPPTSVPFERVGFNDFVLDPDGAVRRNLLFADGQGQTFYSFALRLALVYLRPKGILPKADRTDPNTIYLGRAVLQPLTKTAGGYETIDDRGYQLLLKYRGKRIARQVSLSEVLSGQLQPEWVKDKVVLIGTTAESGRDLFFTPYSAIERDAPRMAGVVLHGQMVSQIVSAALGERPLVWFWPDWAELLWIGGWAIGGGMLAWGVRRPLKLGLGGTGMVTVLLAIGVGAFTQQGWLPIATPALAAMITGGIVVTYRGYWMLPSDLKGKR